MKKTLVILPVFNEEGSILDVLKGLLVDLVNLDVDILIVDDGSTDNTPELLEGAGVDLLIRHPRNQGYGKSLIDGFAFAIKNNYRYALTMDCDGQHEPPYIPAFLEEISNFDIVSGSRYLSASSRISEPPRDRLEINRTITQLIRKITEYNITDSFCGFKAYRTEGLKRLNLTEYGYGMPLQLWIQASRAGLTLKEIPAPLIYKSWSRDFKGVFKTNQERLKYYIEVIDREWQAS